MVILEHQNIFKSKTIKITMNKWFELFLGLILIIGAVLVWAFSGQYFGEFWDFSSAAWMFFKGGLIWFLIMIGLLFILLGISDLKD